MRRLDPGDGRERDTCTGKGQRPRATPPVRVAVLNSHPIQYFAPLYAYLSRAPDIDLTVLYCSDASLRGARDPGFGQAVRWDIDLLGGYRSKFLGARARKRRLGGFFSLVCPEVWSEVRHGGYDALILHGYGYAAYVLAYAAALRSRVAIMLRTETHLGLARLAWKRALRDVLLSLAYRHIQGFLAIGTRNRGYYQSLGVPPDRIVTMPYAVDNVRFMASSSLTLEERARVREKYGIAPTVPLILFASKLIPRKHPNTVVSAVAALRQRGVECALLVVGAGELEQELRSTAAALGTGVVNFSGFVNQTELPRVYGAADVFVLPAASEPWGLVVNEVMCAGLPVILSDSMGCAPDLVREGVNGYLVPSGDANALVKALEPLLADEGLRRTMGQKSREIIQGWGFAQCLSALREALARIGCR